MDILRKMHVGSFFHAAFKFSPTLHVVDKVLSQYNRCFTDRKPTVVLGLHTRDTLGFPVGSDFLRRLQSINKGSIRLKGGPVFF